MLQQQQRKKPDQIDRILRYERGDLTDDETTTLFQELIDNGMAWRLQGHYGRTAMAMIEEGRCVRRDK